MNELTTDQCDILKPNGRSHMPMPTTTSTIRLASEGDLRVHWPFIRRGLSAIKKRQGWRSTWRPEHVRAAIIAGQSELWLGYQAQATPIGVTPPQGEPIAFSITQPMTDPFLNQPLGMFVWFSYKDPHVTSDIVQVMDDHLSAVARYRGFQYLEALTARPGLGRRMRKHGWVVTMEVIRKDLWVDDDEVK